MGVFSCVNGTVKHLKDIIKSRDMYAKPFSFTYKGEENFKTTFGGFISIIITSIVLVYGVQRFIVMINRDDTNTTFNKSISSVSDTDNTIDLSQFSFYFGLELKYNNKNLLNDSSYFTMTMSLLEEDSSGNSKSTTIPYDYCKNTYYSYTG